MAKLSYRLPKKTQKKFGKTAFFSGLSLLLFLALSYIVLSPPDFPVCTEKNLNDCTCPADVSKIGERSIILIDTTDPLRGGKYGDVERLLTELAGSRKDLFSWLADGKTVNKLTVYLLADKNPADMTPIASYCQLPPNASLIVSNKSAIEIREIEDRLRQNAINAARLVTGLSAASSSPIIESLSTITSNSSSWTPGGDLVIVSDMIQNSESCGWFNSVAVIPPFSKTTKECKQYVNRMIDNILPSETYTKSSVIAVCMLPRQSMKIELKRFWSEIFQNGLSYDIVWTCDPNEIASRREFLSKTQKKMQIVNSSNDRR